MDILRWQRVDSLQFHGLFEAVVALLLAEKQTGEINSCESYSTIYIYTHIFHRYRTVFYIYGKREKSHSKPPAYNSTHTVDTWYHHWHLIMLSVRVVKTPFLHSVTWQEDVAMNTFVTVWNSKIQNLFPLKSITATRLQKEWHAYMPAVEKLCMIVNTRHGHNKQKVLHFTDCYSTMFFKRRLTF